MRKASDIEHKLWEKEVFDDDEFFLESDTFGEADHRATPDEVLNEFDRLLKPLGLGIVWYDTKSDFFSWKIEKVPNAEDKNMPLVGFPRGDEETS